MRDAKLLFVLTLISQKRSRLRASLRDLRRRLNEELMRAEHARLVRIRHYMTVSCLPKPDVAPWMYIWIFGSDENFLTVTSLYR